MTDVKNAVAIALSLMLATLSLRDFAAASPDFASTLTPTVVLTATTTPRITPTAGTPTPTYVISTTIAPTPTATITRATFTPTPTRNPLPLDANALAITTLRARRYGGDGIKSTRVVFTNDAYKQVLIEYFSDGLRITGTMNVPRGIGPFPVVILDHGYFKPAEYKTGDGTSRAADAFARHGYLTLAPDYRCYAGSQCGANPLYVGYAIDVLNLLAQVSSLPDADPARVGIWGHSMGGGVTLRVLAITNDIKVAALYGALTGDDEVQYCWLQGCRVASVPTPESRFRQAIQDAQDDALLYFPTPVASNDPLARLRDIFALSSPSRHLQYITTPLIIHHGESDDTVPIQWSVDLADALTARGKTAMLYTYPGEGHVFAGWGWQLFSTRTLAFFDEFLNPRASMITVEKRVLRQEQIALEASY
jgi:dienelactone hydrolase